MGLFSTLTIAPTPVADAASAGPIRYAPRPSDSTVARQVEALSAMAAQTLLRPCP